MNIFADQLTTENAPWWAVAVIAGGLSIVAGALGGLISFWSLKKSDDRHASREEVAYRRKIDGRWDDDVRRRSTDFVTRTRALEKAARQLEIQIVKQFGPPPYPDPMALWFQVKNTRGQRVVPLLWNLRVNACKKQQRVREAAEESCIAAVTQLVIIAPDSIIKQARVLLDAALAHANGFSGGGDRAALEDAYGDELRTFHRVVRDELRTRVDREDPAF